MVAMNLLNSYLLYTTTVFITLLHLSSLASCFDQQRTISVPPKDLFLMEEKTRLGSTPPSCYNKCDECHPCTAVQVPTVPIQNRVRPASGRTIPMELVESSSFSPSTSGKKYSDYKPLGWKCRCRDRLFNP